MNKQHSLRALCALSILFMASLAIAEKHIPRHRRLRAQRRARNLTQQTKTISKMTFEELKKAKDLLVTYNNKDLVPKYLERMIILCDNPKARRDLRIDLGDAYYALGEYEKAEKIFTEFADEFRNHKHTEYASYKAILCSFHGTLISERDQKKTYHTISLTDSFIERKDVFTKYASDVLDIRTACYKKAVESEVNIFNFYLHRNQLTSAQTRLDNIAKSWTQKYPAIEVQLAQLRSQLEDKRTKNNALTLASNKKSRNKRSHAPVLVAQAPKQSEQSDSKKTFTSRF